MITYIGLAEWNTKYTYTQFLDCIVPYTLIPDVQTLGKIGGLCRTNKSTPRLCTHTFRAHDMSMLRDFHGYR